MRKFQFSMQALYDVKKADEKQAQVDYVTTRDKREQLEEQARACWEEIAQGQNRLECLAGHGILVHDFQNACVYLKTLRKRAVLLDEDVSRVGAEEVEKQQVLREIYRDKKALERLREKQYSAYLTEQNMKEAKEMEDLLMFGMLEKLKEH